MYYLVMKYGKDLNDAAEFIDEKFIIATTCEHRLSKLTMKKDYLRSTMDRKKLLNLVI